MGKDRPGTCVALPQILQPHLLPGLRASANANQSPVVSERSCLEEMVSDLPRALVEGIGIKPLGRVGDEGVQLLSPRGRDAGKQRLTHKFMGEGKRLLESRGVRDDYS